MSPITDTLYATAIVDDDRFLARIDVEYDAFPREFDIPQGGPVELRHSWLNVDAELRAHISDRISILLHDGQLHTFDAALDEIRKTGRMELDSPDFNQDIGEYLCAWLAGGDEPTYDEQIDITEEA